MVNQKAGSSTSSRSLAATHITAPCTGLRDRSAFEATRLQADDTRVNKQGKMLHEENYDVGADLGGYVPGLQNKLFFFGSFNPTIRREIVQAVSANATDVATATQRL